MNTYGGETRFITRLNAAAGLYDSPRVDENELAVFALGRRHGNDRAQPVTRGAGDGADDGALLPRQAIEKQ